MFLSYAETYHSNAGTGDRCWDGARAPLERGVEEALNVGRRAAVGAASWPARRVGGSEPPALPDGYDGGAASSAPSGGPVGVALARARPHPP